MGLRRTKRKTLLKSLCVTILSLTGVLALFGGAGCGKKGEDEAAKAQKTSIKDTALLVKTTPVRTGTIENVAQVTGSLTALNDVTIGTKLAGKIVGVYAREGDKVRAGQVMVQMDTADYLAQLDQQKANLLSAQTKLTQARVLYQTAVTNLKLTDDQTRSAVRQAEAALRSAKDQEAIVREGARRQERQQAEENVAAAKADRDKARSDLKRYQDLYRQQAVAAQQLDQAQAVADAADARYNSAQQSLSLLQEGARPQEINRAVAAVEQARQSLVTAQANRQQVSLRRSDIENNRAGILTAQAAVRQAEAAVRLAEQAISDAAIRSPIDGIVAERKAEIGQQMGAGKDVMRIVSLKDIYFDAQLSETQFAEVQVGQPVTVSSAAIPGRTFSGKVSKLFPAASSTARSFTVRVVIAGEGDLLRPQTFAQGRIVLANHANAHLIPRNAILDLNDGKGRVFVVSGGKAEEKKVKVGFISGEDAEILSGLEANAQVIVSGQAQVQNGDKVQVQTGSEPVASASPPASS